ncbi:MAG: proton-conducting transporter membrane subunit [Phycisphaerales bacterium]
MLGSLGAGQPMFVSMMGKWAPPFGIAIVFDGLSGTLLAVALTVAVAAYIHSWNLLPRHIEHGWFHPLFHMLILGVNFSFLTGDLFNLFVAFEIMLMASYALMCLGGTRQQMSQAFKYVLLNLVGSTVFVLTAGMIYGVTGTLNYADLARFVAENEGALPPAFRRSRSRCCSCSA